MLLLHVPVCLCLLFSLGVSFRLLIVDTFLRRSVLPWDQWVLLTVHSLEHCCSARNIVTVPCPRYHASLLIYPVFAANACSNPFPRKETARGEGDSRAFWMNLGVKTRRTGGGGAHRSG